MQSTFWSNLAATLLLTVGFACAVEDGKRAVALSSNDAVAVVTLAAAKGFEPREAPKATPKRPESRKEGIVSRGIGALAAAEAKPSPFAYSKTLRAKR
jgi:hypothetical protein